MSKTPIGKTIRRLRMEQGFSQQGFAQKLGISTSYLNLVEHDQRNVTASLLFKLTSLLNVDLAALSGVGHVVESDTDNFLWGRYGGADAPSGHIELG